MSDDRAILLEILAASGVTEQDHDDIERARAIVHQVNERLWKRRARHRYSVTFTGAQPEYLWGDWDCDDEDDEDDGEETP